MSAARDRPTEFAVTEHVGFVVGDAAAFDPGSRRFDVVCCLGATWIGGGLQGTLDLLRGAAQPDGWYPVRECFWAEPPPPEAVAVLRVESETFTSLAGTAERFRVAGLDLVEMVLANPDDWDRYEGGHWKAVTDWLAAHPDDPDQDAIRAEHDHWQHAHLQYLRRYLGWGVFALRPISG